MSNSFQFLQNHKNHQYSCFSQQKSHSLDSLVNRIIQAEESWKFLSGTVRPIPLQIIFILWEKYYSFSVLSLSHKYLILVTASQSTLGGSLPLTCRNILFCNLYLSSQDISCSSRLPDQRNKQTFMQSECYEIPEARGHSEIMEGLGTEKFHYSTGG